ncbi:MAG: hypothetical protein ACK5YR_08335 [Pirellula sp.]|jgi:hypothetical protein
MRRRPKLIEFEIENAEEIESIKSKIGTEVPLSRRCTQGAKALLVSTYGDRATIQFPNGATMGDVPVRDLVDDRGYWYKADF